VDAAVNALANEPAVILIIDEDALTLTGMAAVLNMCGHECHCARDRAAALKAVRTLALDLIICDVNLRDESGLDLCRDLRLEPGVEDVPLMFISAAQMPDIVRRSHEAGGAYFLRAPFDPEVLTELVAKALWMPHLVTTRVTRRQAVRQPSPQPAAVVPKPNLIFAAIRGIRIPQA
jgi:CheY-like chemotaxis protein